ncbi:LysR family transcriptional regulator [Peristeroidobacter soli]|uniref:LysR family transcriptional regulator n=1 Tax=Peristeroidobacter soli TaxID=2497877 RepID=UPI00101CEC2C|nr:LysR family transcriptional regulator [Peristeroidobacter soli]
MDIAKIDLNLLVVLDVLLRARSVTAAAKLLDMSQPATSYSLNRLRKLFGDQLFVRTPRGIEPTPFAERLTIPVREVLERIRSDVLQQASFEPATARGTVTIAMHDIGELVLMPRILEAFMELAPGLDVSTVQLPEEEIEPALRSGAVDLAIGSYPSLTGAALYQQRLFAHSFVCVTRDNNRRLGQEISRKQFIEALHGVVHAQGSTNDILEDELAEQGLHRRIVVRVGNFLAVPMILKQSDLIFTVPHAIGASLSQLTGLRLMEPPFTVKSPVVRQHWHTRFHNDARIRWLRGLISKLFLQVGEPERRKRTQKRSR